ncbi:hypothetical protein [Aquimarina sediminis]|uniref:hypothetical protein n=1 Tax=Aquimarina sediminis TaxID=2070536 RepID=UPI000CA0135A|nr:hypothetical protein [Aquimarina sediminis]
MKNQKIFNLLLIPVITIIILFSCRNDSDIHIKAPAEQILKSNSKVANLISKISMNDGSIDNIIDKLTCSTIKLPVTLIVNGSEEIINIPKDFRIIKHIFMEFDNDVDKLDIIFPITLISNDFSETIIENNNQLKELTKNCSNNDGSDDEDIECIDFQYPFSVSAFNFNNELIDTYILNSDKEFYQFIQSLDPKDIANIDFPITVVLSDGTEISIVDLEDLENNIEKAKNDCDENDLTEEYFTQVIINKTLKIQKYKDNQNNETNNYLDYIFDFSEDGTVITTNNSDSSITNGTWSISTKAEGGLDISLDFNNEEPLHKLNRKWNVKQIKNTRIMLEYSKEQGISKDELFFEQMR